MRILVTDGMDKTAMAQLREAGHEVVEQFYAPEELGAALREFDAVVVRSKTKVRANHIDEAKGGKLKLIIRGGVGVDNIDVKYAEANGIYDEIDEDSEAYYSAQVKKAGNLVTMQDYAAAELLLKSLTLENPRNYQLLLDLGDVLRIRNKQDEAVSYYKDAIKSLPKIENQHWVLFYALGISYESLGEWKEAEKNFRKSLALSQNHYLVLNFLGYSLLKHGKNVDEAFGMIVDAYNQIPNDGHITDSLGWAFYRLGQYDKAIEYLEKAAELEPSNALISDHLGDAYWFGGRRNEAVFQWNHALILEDDSGELDKSKVREKLASRNVDNKVLKYTPAVVNEKISQITKE